jgi:23S rRNA pseudouridine1911/1915/1917 synthase
VRAPAPLTVPGALAGARADRALAELLELPVGAVRRLLVARRLRIDGRVPKKGDAVRAGAVITLESPALHPGGWLVAAPAGDADDAAALPVLYQDAGVIIVDKPAGVPSHPLLPGEGGTVVDKLAVRYPEIAAASDEAREAGLVHRLDTGTSGCLAVARDRESWRALRAAFSQGAVDKGYRALVHGRVQGPLEIDGAIAHDPADARRMVIAPGGLAAGPGPAVTTVAPLLVGPAHTLVSVTAAGGRRHQVRVHLASAGHPLVGDVLYGAPEAGDVPWHLLHAASLGLPGRPVVHAPLPAPFRAACEARGLVPGRNGL